MPNAELNPVRKLVFSLPFSRYQKASCKQLSMGL